MKPSNQEEYDELLAGLSDPSAWGPYVGAMDEDHRGVVSILLDGHFTANDLRRIADYVEKHQS